MKFFVILCLFLFQFQVQAKNKIEKDPLLTMPTLEEFKRLKQSQKRDLVLAFQKFIYNLSKDPSLKATAGLNQKKYQMIFELLTSEGFAQEGAPDPVIDNRSPQQRAYDAERAQEREQVDIVARRRARAAMSPALREATENLERIDAEINARVQRVADAHSRLNRVRQQQRVSDPNDADRQAYLRDELDKARDEVRAAERAVQDGGDPQARIGIARARVERIKREEEDAAREGRLDEYRRRAGNPDAADAANEVAARRRAPDPAQAPPEPGQKYSCIYAGFAIPDNKSCVAPYEWTGRVPGQQSDVKFSCRAQTNASANPPVFGKSDQSLTVLCNPVLFGSDNGNPICVERNKDATKQCLEKSGKLSNLDNVIALIEANPDQYNSLMEMYGRLCRGGSATQIADYLETYKSTLLRSSTPPARINDIGITCERFRDQYGAVYQRARTSGKGSVVPVNPATGRR